ncbi:MAG: hypothetical protein ACPGWR_10305 [Ardenticatenaceae bacterium]
MKAHYRFQDLADFIISRAFILLIISIFLFPLIIQTRSAQAQKENFGPCNFNLPSSSSIAPHTTGATPTSRIPLQAPQPINSQIYALSVLGWWTCPPSVIFGKQNKKKTRKQRSMWNHFHLEGGLDYLTNTYLQTICRTLLLLSLWLCTEHWLPNWVVWLPAVEWIFSGAWRAWPWLAQQPEAVSIRRLFSTVRVITFWLLAARIVWLWADLPLATVRHFGSPEVGLVAGLVVSKENSAQSPQISISRWKEKDGYKIHLSGEFYFTVDSSDPFWTRTVIIFLRQLQSEQVTSRGRSTRDGRRPIVSQTRLAEAFSITQPEISRWEKYWLDQDWPNLLSLKSSQILTLELRQQIVEVFARYPWWGVERVYEHLHQQGIKVTQSQIREAALTSGWRHLRQTLNRFFVVSEENIRPRDEALVKQLLNQVQVLLEKLKNSDQLTSQEELDITYLQSASNELGIVTEPKNVTFWGQKIKNVLLQDSTCEKASCCPHCGSNKVRPKGTKGYQKRYLDENGEWQSREVFPKFCDNPDCKHKVFTDLPLDLLPHSPYSLGIRLQAA